MKTPADKLANGRNDIVQIIVAPHSCDIAICSNCTQLIPFRKDREFMLPDVFRQAVRSLEGYPGVRALFGGNPATSPYFEDYCRILREEVPDQRQRGLWTNDLMTDAKASAARETFYPLGRHNLNVHCDRKAAERMRQTFPGWTILGEDKRSWHSPILMDYRDLGIEESDWIAMRESCDINQNWSAAIIQRNFGDGPAPAVYFCEVAAALDGVRGENHGLPAVKGWWRLSISHFSGQIEAGCDSGCGVPLRRKGHRDLDFTYDYSESWAEIVEPRTEKLVQLEGVKHATTPEGTSLATDYQRLWTR